MKFSYPKLHWGKLGYNIFLDNKSVVPKIYVTLTLMVRVDGEYYQASNVTQDRTQKDYRVSLPH